MMLIQRLVYWILRIVAALIMLQTLFFKFTASEESVYIFTTVGMEPWGRISIGILELIASIFLLINRTAWMGAALALGLMLGAMGMHLTRLGISVQGDGGYLFFLALAVTLCSAVILIMDRHHIVNVVRTFTKGIS